MNRRKISTFAICTLLILAICLTGTDRMTGSLVLEAEAASGPYLKITAIDYGGSSTVCGDATLLESGGQYLLIDTGAKDGNNTVIRYLKKRGARNLSLYISHYHEDHCYYAASIIKDPWFKIKKVYLANPDPLSRYVTSYQKKHNRKLYNNCKNCLNRYKKIVSAASARKVPVKRLKRGNTFSIGSASARVLWDSNTRGVGSFDPYDKNGDSYINNNSLVTRFTLGNKSYLSCGDIEASSERDLMANGTNISADILKLNHHAIWNANTAEFVKKVNPCYIYYSYKVKNKDPESKSFGTGADIAVTVRKLKNAFNMLSTRYNGNITYHIQNNTISVSCQRHYSQKTVKVRNTSNKKVSSKTLVYNNAQTLHLDKRMLPYGTVLVKGNAADPSKQRNGWIKTSAGWRYRQSNGKYLTGGWKTVSGNTYYFNKNGIRYEGWLTLGGKRYFMSRTGIRQTGWQMIDGKFYYFYPNGVMASGTIKIGSTKWPLKSDGSLNLKKKKAPGINVITVERRHTTK